MLPDGGHFERSPMYHSLILEDVLDLHQPVPDAVSASPGSWSASAGRMLGWLGQMCHPDGRIAFFNDAAFDVAPAPDALFEYAGVSASRSGPCRCGKAAMSAWRTDPPSSSSTPPPSAPISNPATPTPTRCPFELSHRGRRVIVELGHLHL